MIFTPTAIAGVVIIDPERRTDARGWFARTYCGDAFAAHGLNTAWPQCNASFNQRRGTLRGLHWQGAPHGETKLVRCTRGGAYDVAVDVRRGSPTFGRWVAVEITADNGRALYIDAGLAHGFQALTDATELFYQMGTPHAPGFGRGIRHDDPDLSIPWPLSDRILSDADRALPSFASLAANPGDTDPGGADPGGHG